MKLQLLRPIKAPSEQILFTSEFIRYPMYASIKYDGFRGVLLGDRFFSPMMKPFTNNQLWKHFEKTIELAQEHKVVFDGEIWHPEITFTELSSRLRAGSGMLDGVQYHIFDCLTHDEWNGQAHSQFNHRQQHLEVLSNYFTPDTKRVEQLLVLNSEDAANQYAKFLGAGHEGIILRSPTGVYKHNRCTHREGNMFKFKVFQTEDAVIVEVVQRRKMLDVERTYNPFGLLEKINTQESYGLDEAVGAFQVRLSDGRLTSVNLGRGFSYSARQKFWTLRDSLVGKHIEFKYMPHGTKELPRIGSMIRFRPDKDL